MKTKHSKTSFLLSLAVLALVVMATGNSYAQDLGMRHSPRSMQGIRPLTMGGAFIAVDGSDENALFYNPATINDLEDKIHMQFMLPTVEFSYKAIPFLANDITDLADNINAQGTNAGKINVFNAFTNTHTGRYEELGLHGSIANFMWKWLAASIFYENRSVLALTNPASATVDIESVSQGGLQVGSAYSLFDDKLKVGAAVKFVARHLIDEQVTQRDIIANATFGDAIQTDQVGYGLGVDLGVKAKLPWSTEFIDYLDPTFAIVLQDVGHTRFFAGDSVGQMRESLTVGSAVHPNFWKFKNNLALDVRDLDVRSDFITKLHIGWETNWNDISKVLRSVSVRAGYGQGYLSGGVGFDFKYFKLNAGTYGREVGQNTRQKESRMVGVQLAAGF